MEKVLGMSHEPLNTKCLKVKCLLRANTYDNNNDIIRAIIQVPLIELIWE